MGQRLRCTSAELYARLQAGERRALGQALTLVESNHMEHRQQADTLLLKALECDRRCLRLGISGPPGAGKSTFIDAMGMYLVSLGLRVGVFAVDPTSVKHGGSVLGDKTRMHRLAQEPRAFVRPSPSKGHLGGVTANAYESTLLFEVAGYDVVLIETVGVGQSEVAVADLADCFLFLIPPSSGDELHGIKKGIVEVSDILCITKADGKTLPQAEKAVDQYSSAMRLLYSTGDKWEKRVLLTSAKEPALLKQVWEEVQRHQEVMRQEGEFARRREAQRQKQLWNNIQAEVVHRLQTLPSVQGVMGQLERQVLRGTVTPRRACYQILDLPLRPLRQAMMEGCSL
eukprot:EG_transcript_12536